MVALTATFIPCEHGKEVYTQTTCFEKNLSVLQTSKLNSKCEQGCIVKSNGNNAHSILSQIVAEVA